MSELVIDPVLRQRYVFEQRSDAEGDYVELEMWVDDGGGVTPHVHPTQEERFTLVDGSAEVLTGREWRTLAPGETAVVAPGTRHAFRNRSGREAHLRVQARPPESLEAFLTEVAALSRSGALMRPGLPRNLRGLLGSAVIAKAYRDSTVLELPPVWVQRLLLDPLVPIANRRGFRAGRPVPA